MSNVERYIHHGNDVAVISEVKGKHRDHCLCFQGCKFFKPGEQDNCNIAQANYTMCVNYGLVTPVYECPKYEAQQPAQTAREVDVETVREALKWFADRGFKDPASPHAVDGLAAFERLLNNG